MAVFSSRSALAGLAVVLISVLAGAANALSPNFYSKSCPKLGSIVRSEMESAVKEEKRMAASMLRLFFHDCFVNGCDASILLDDTSTFTGEKNAGPNANSVRGYEVIDAIKTKVEASCNATVSCADIVALATRDGVNLVGGPTWNVTLGRKDSRTANQSSADNSLPGPSSSLADLIKVFSEKNLSRQDMTALSGAHTMGRSRCQFFRDRIYSEQNINTTFAEMRQKTCPLSGGDNTLAPFDVLTPNKFDNAYYKNLVAQRGLLQSDQVLFKNSSSSQDALVRLYSTTPSKFSADFASAMLKLGSLMPSPGTPTEIRLNCRRPNLVKKKK